VQTGQRTGQQSVPGWEEPVRLKLYMVQARLYSFWLGDV
jgi:hypothetical protein